MCPACSYRKATCRAAGDVAMLLLVAAVVSEFILALALAVEMEFGLPGVAESMAVTVSRVLATVLPAGVLFILFLRVDNVSTMRRYMREFGKPCLACGGGHE